MMGLHATATKRKLEDGGGGGADAEDGDWMLRPQAKVGRTDTGSVSDDWGVDSTSAALATSLLSDTGDDSDDDDDEDDVEEGDEAYLPAGRGYQMGYTTVSAPQYDQGYPYRGGGGYHRGYWGPPGQPGQAGQPGPGPNGASQPSPPAPAGYYRQDVVASAPVPNSVPSVVPNAVQPPPAQTPPPQRPPASHQQTIRCEENGKSYLDLGSSYPVTTSASSGANQVVKCCDGSRTSWCSRGPGPGAPGSCYRQRRLAVLNLSMCKLGRYRQFSDPSLRRSVLICNTLRLLEREMDQDGCFFNSPAQHAAREPCGPCPAPAPAAPLPVHQPPPHQPAPLPLPLPPTYHHQQFPEVPLGMPMVNGHGYPGAGAGAGAATPYRLPEPTTYEQNFRELTTPLRPTPFPSPAHPGCDADSGLGDDDSTRGINWGSVLSLSSQSDLDPLNNNELFPTSPSPTLSPSPPSPAPSVHSNSDSLGLLGDEELGHEFDDFLPSWKLTPLSADDLLKSVPCGPSANVNHPGEGELDSIMHVLVGS
ncbi:Cell division cycle-associated protein 4 [Frankliniella fusca]|uniref:Cell division cycle-associated protein 4 n=1 Tax=Frankliniella fusca TaxID=407009 RepID=A0AAE1H100_9NEOP|nr:Cell division cycle-associated protein 4 [Frankliniella fusca]